MSTTQNEGFFARLTFAEIDRYATDEYAKEVILKAYAIGYTAAFFTVYLASALMAWFLPGLTSLWALAPIVALALAELISSQWMRIHIPRPGKLRSWSGIILMMIPTVALFAGLYYNAARTGELETASGFLTSGIAGIAAVLIAGPALAKWSSNRDHKRINAALDAEGEA